MWLFKGPRVSIIIWWMNIIRLFSLILILLPVTMYWILPQIYNNIKFLCSYWLVSVYGLYSLHHCIVVVVIKQGRKRLRVDSCKHLLYLPRQRHQGEYRHPHREANGVAEQRLSSSAPRRSRLSVSHRMARWRSSDRRWNAKWECTRHRHPKPEHFY